MTAGIGVLVQRLGGMITVVDLVKGGPADLAKDLKIGQVPSHESPRSRPYLPMANIISWLLTKTAQGGA